MVEVSTGSKLAGAAKAGINMHNLFTNAPGILSMLFVLHPSQDPGKSGW